jgi:hypothetical protein
LTDTSITMTATRDIFGVNNVSFDGVEFIDLNGTLDFSSFALDQSATTYAQFSASKVTHGVNKLFINIDGPNALTGQQIVLNQAPVPLPAALWLLGPVLGGLGFMRRRVA